MGERRGKMVYWKVEADALVKRNERGGKVIKWLVEIAMNNEVKGGERGGEVIHGVIE